MSLRLDTTNRQTLKLGPNVLRPVSVAILLLVLTACAQHEIDSFEKYCEDLRGVDLQRKYQPFWAGIFTFSYKADAIRDDYVAFLDTAYMKDLAGRTKRMVWREQRTLHLTNLSSFWILDPEDFIREWRGGLEGAQKRTLKSDAEICLFGPGARLFDEIVIHSWTTKGNLGLDSEKKTSLSTDRKRHFGWVPD